MVKSVQPVTLENATLVQLIDAFAQHATKHHDVNDYFTQACYRDLCYTTNNSLDYKARSMADLQPEIAELIPEEGSEIVDVNLEIKVKRYHRMEIEREALIDRLTAVKQAYKTFSGEEWMPNSRSKLVKNSQAISTDARRIAGL